MGYRIDLTDKQWDLLDPFFAEESLGKHFPRHSKRELINAVLYLNKTGCNGDLCPMILRLMPQFGHFTAEL